MYVVASVREYSGMMSSLRGGGDISQNLTIDDKGLHQKMMDDGDCMERMQKSVRPYTTSRWRRRSSTRRPSSSPSPRITSTTTSMTTWTQVLLLPTIVVVLSTVLLSFQNYLMHYVDIQFCLLFKIIPQMTRFR